MHSKMRIFPIGASYSHQHKDSNQLFLLTYSRIPEYWYGACKHERKHFELNVLGITKEQGTYKERQFMRALFIYEELFYPFDEGMKKFSNKIYQSIGLHMKVQAIKDICWLPAFINSFLIVPRILMANLVNTRDVVVYIPKQSLTFISLIKAFLLYLFFRRKLRTIGLQRRNISGIKATIIRHLTFGNVYVLSHSMKKDLRALNIDTEVIFTGIDTDRFTPPKSKLTP